MKRRTTVENVMIREVTCIHENTTLVDAARCIVNSPQLIFPVVDDSGKYKGIFSPIDLFRPSFPMSNCGVYPDLKAIFAETIGPLAHHENVVLSPTDTVTDVARAMLDLRVQSLPVVDAGQVVGIVTAKNVLKLLV